MPRRKTSFVKGNHYHIFNRGVAKQPIFLDPSDYEFFTQQLYNYAQQLAINIIAFCLLPNHYHIFVRQESEVPAGRLPQFVCNRYSKIFNQKYDRSGTLFQGRFGARSVQDQSYAQHLCAYIHANPSISGLVARPEKWPYSDLDSWLNPKKATKEKRMAMTSFFPSDIDYKSYMKGVLEQKLFSKFLEPS